MLLTDKVAIITGAAQGIGKGIAEVFSHEGALVALCDCNSELVRSVAKEVRAQTGREARAFVVDVSKRDEVRAAVRAVKEAFGTIDILVNNAGIIRLAPLLDMKEETWDEVFAVNVKGAFLFSQAAAEIMIEKRYGKIINVASDSGVRPELRECAYCASKSALIGFTRVVALELGPYGITCNALCPGATDTPLLRENYMKSEEDIERLKNATALKRIASPKDIGSVALFLASSLSDHVTGEHILVTAGDPMSQ